MAGVDSTEAIEGKIAETIQAARVALERISELMLLFNAISKLTEEDAELMPHLLSDLGSRLCEESCADIATELEWLAHYETATVSA